MSNGRIVQIIGAVIDVEFPRDSVPKVYDALTVDGKGLTLEVQQQLGDGVVRTIAMGSSEGISRGLSVDTSAATMASSSAFERHSPIARTSASNSRECEASTSARFAVEASREASVDIGFRFRFTAAVFCFEIGNPTTLRAQDGDRGYESCFWEEGRARKGRTRAEESLSLRCSFFFLCLRSTIAFFFFIFRVSEKGVSFFASSSLSLCLSVSLFTTRRIPIP